MLKSMERRILFWMFVVLTCLLGVSEAFIVYKAFADGATISQAFVAFFNSGLLVGCGLLFQKLFTQSFLREDLVPIRSLQRLMSDRRLIFKSATSSDQSRDTTRQLLLTNTLKFAETTLSNLLPGTHFEFCVFSGSEAPDLISYWDSTHTDRARSMKARQENPNYYVDEGYEVVRILREPSSQLYIVDDTLAETSNYNFVGEGQKKQIRSTLIMSLDTECPAALVVTSNEKGAFDSSNNELQWLLKTIGEFIQQDLDLEAMNEHSGNALEHKMFLSDEVSAKSKV